MFPYPLLVCDIGGTNARFASVAGPSAPLVAEAHLKTGNFASLEEALQEVLAGLASKPRSLIACVAGPVRGRFVKMTNADWVIDGAAVAARTGLDQGLLLNDFEAQAFSLPVLKPDWVKPLASFERQPGPQLIVGLGTGLGVAALIEVSGRYLVLPSEAGHMSFGPIGPEQEAVWKHIDTGGLERISTETILSGHGLLRLHQARCLAADRPTDIFNEITLIETAKNHPQGEEARTLRYAWALTARFAGDLALAFLTVGGVTFAGGVLPRLLDFFDPQEFRHAFEDKAPYGEMMAAIGTQLILTEDTVLAGMAAIAAAPERYAIDYPARAWRWPAE
ncbi:MAG TPA: glucokinase [Methylocella sp.]|nr:glucokinase [Methylocella sp.]